MTAGRDSDEPASGERGRDVSAAEARVCECVASCREVMMEAATRLLDGNRDAAEDVVQRACVAALEHAHRKPDEVHGIRKPCAWLVRITRRQASGVLRTEARRRRLRRENGDEIRENLCPAPGAGSEGNLQALQAECVLEAAPRVLTGRQLAVVLLALEGMADQEAARELGLHRGTVRRHRTEATRKLREHMSLELVGGGLRHERFGCGAEGWVGGLRKAGLNRSGDSWHYNDRERVRVGCGS